MNPVIPLNYLQKIVEGHDLTIEEAEALMGEIFNSATDAQIGALLIALRMKGESVSEIAGLARKMRDSAVRIRPKVKGTLVDTCGTGGDASNTINVSTAAAIVSAACGVPVAKHGNYAVSSKCGSANVLSELGVNISPAPEEVQAMIETMGIGFMLAPIFHPAMKRVAPHPARAGHAHRLQHPGAADQSRRSEGAGDGRLRSAALREAGLGSYRCWEPRGPWWCTACGMDEITNTGETHGLELKDGVVKSYSFMPQDLGYPLARPEEIAGGTPEENARKLVEVMKGERSPARDIIAMNAGAAVYVSGQASTLKEGARMAEEALDSGRALQISATNGGDERRLRQAGAVPVTRIKVCGIMNQPRPLCRLRSRSGCGGICGGDRMTPGTASLPMRRRI